MAKSNELVGNSVIRAALTVLREQLPVGDTTTCVAAADVASDKRVAKAFTVDNATVLRQLVLLAATNNQLNGFSARPGKGGGIHRVINKRNRQGTAQTA